MAILDALPYTPARLWSPPSSMVLAAQQCSQQTHLSHVNFLPSVMFKHILGFVQIMSYN